MKLLRCGPLGNEKPRMIDSNEKIRYLSNIVEDIDDTVLSSESLVMNADLNPDDLPLVEGNPRFKACVDKIGKLICIGLNYAYRAAESGIPIPSEPEDRL
jgi:ureidoglycolate lyase|tara:strand:+ start:7707 stop:8006 length:300 start_codon:yes stop_codon:yes gene_type:complete